MNIAVKEMRTEARRMLEAAERGEEVTITYRGRPRARLIAIAESDAEYRAADDELFGMWADRDDMEDVAAWVAAQRRDRCL